MRRPCHSNWEGKRKNHHHVIAISKWQEHKIIALAKLILQEQLHLCLPVCTFKIKQKCATLLLDRQLEANWTNTTSSTARSLCFRCLLFSTINNNIEKHWRDSAAFSHVIIILIICYFCFWLLRSCDLFMIKWIMQN